MFFDSIRRNVAGSRTHVTPLRRGLAEEGQALILVALMLVVLLLFVGLGVDVGYLMARRAKLQSAVDHAALSSAQMLLDTSTLTAREKAEQIMTANGVPLDTLEGGLTVTLPGPRQVYVRAVQNVDTFFMRLIPAFATVNVAAEATADINNYAEILAKPYGESGIVNELNLMVWGAEATRSGGDPYSPIHIGNGNSASNPWHGELPYGYMFRIDVPPSYPHQRLVVQIFDPDTYNRPGTPPAWNPSGPNLNPDAYANCANPRNDPRPSHQGGDWDNTCTSGQSNSDPGIKLNAFPDPKDPSNITIGRPGFWRVDEYRTRYTSGLGGSYPNNATTTQFTLWHFDPHITSAFGDPADLSDTGGYIARYTIKESPNPSTDRYGPNAATDLWWVQPEGFELVLNDYARESNGGWYFYLYVQGIAGSSENNYDLRVGPPNSEWPSNQDCRLLSPSRDERCYVNRLYYDQMVHGIGAVPNWDSRGAQIFAKRALPLNLVSGREFPLIFSQVNKNAAGQFLGVRHFDQDCNLPGCGSPITYQMQICGCVPSGDPLDDSCWQDIGYGAVGPNDGWSAPGYPDPEPIQIPEEGSAGYATFFGNGTCETSWLRLRRHPSYSNDTTVWEVPFFRPRLIR